MEKDWGDKDRQWVGVAGEGVRSSTCAIYGVILPCFGHRTMIIHIGERVLDYYYILLHKGIFAPLIFFLNLFQKYKYLGTFLAVQWLSL